MASGGGSVRTEFDNALCEAMFFDGAGNPRPRADYVEIGRRALEALLDAKDSQIDRFRFRLLDDPATWAQAVKTGPSPELSDLIPISSSDPIFNQVLGDVKGDVFDIAWWADGMQKVGRGLQQMRAFLSGRDPASLATDPAFAAQRNTLQKLLLNMVSLS